MIISENPKVNNWHGHGFHYLTKEFYTELCKVAGYELIEVGEHAAMGNVTDGVERVRSVCVKISDVFPSCGEFNELPFTSTLAPDGTEFIPFEGSEAEAIEKAYKQQVFLWMMSNQHQHLKNVADLKKANETSSRYTTYGTD